MKPIKKLPDDWWNHGINPILGYRYKQIQDHRPPRNKFEYPEQDDIKI